MAQVGDAIGSNLPELRIEHLERDAAIVTDSPQVVDDRPELEISLTGQDAVGIAGQAAGRRWQRSITVAAPAVMLLNAGLLLVLAVRTVA